MARLFERSITHLIGIHSATIWCCGGTPLLQALLDVLQQLPSPPLDVFAAPYSSIEGQQAPQRTRGIDVGRDVEAIHLHMHINHVVDVEGQQVHVGGSRWFGPPLEGWGFPHLRVSAGTIPVGNAIDVWQMCGECVYM